MSSLDKLTTKLVNTHIKNLTADSYDVVDAALMEQNYRPVVSQVLELADNLGYLSGSFQDGFKKGREDSQQALENLQAVHAEFYATLEAAEDSELKSALMKIITSS